MQSFGDFDERVPVFKFDSDGKKGTISNIRPSSYRRDAQREVDNVGSRGRIGVIAVNQYGERKHLTYLQKARMVDLFETGQLTIVDHWVDNRVNSMMGMTGFDTEMEGRGDHSMYQMPSYGN